MMHVVLRVMVLGRSMLGFGGRLDSLIERTANFLTDAAAGRQ